MKEFKKIKLENLSEQLNHYIKILENIKEYYVNYGYNKRLLETVEAVDCAITLIELDYKINQDRRFNDITSIIQNDNINKDEEKMNLFIFDLEKRIKKLIEILN